MAARARDDAALVRRGPGRRPGADARPVRDARGADERAPPLQVPPSSAHRRPRSPGRRRPRAHDRGAVAPGRRMHRPGARGGRRHRPRSVRGSARGGRIRDRRRGRRHGQARRRRAQLLVRRGLDVRLRGRRGDGGRAFRTPGQRRVLRARLPRAGLTARGEHRRGLRLPRRSATSTRRAHGPDRALARRVPRVLPRARRAVGATGLDQIAYRGR